MASDSIVSLALFFAINGGDINNRAKSFIFLTSHRNRSKLPSLPLHSTSFLPKSFHSCKKKKCLRMTQVSEEENGHDLIWPFEFDDKSASVRTEEKGNGGVRPQGWKRSKFGQIYTINLGENEKMKQRKPRYKCRSGESSTRYVYSLGFLKFKRQKQDEHISVILHCVTRRLQAFLQ